MNTEVEDVVPRSCNSSEPRSKRRHRILIARDDMIFRWFTLDDPVPLGRQILTVCGGRPDKNHSLFAILPTGDFEDVRLDEKFDIRGRGVERFIVFETDRLFKLALNNAQLQWGDPCISGAALYALADLDDSQAVYRRVPGGTDQLIEPEDRFDLSASGVECFITAVKPISDFEIIINSRQYVVDDPIVTFEQIVKLAFPQSGPTNNVIYSMTYRQAQSKPSASELGAGGKITVKSTGTIFNVTPTVKS